jgi:hypothetical protein
LENIGETDKKIVEHFVNLEKQLKGENENEE